MRIDRLHVQNFKCFIDQTFELHPQFTLLVGENGSGKTALLDALAVALGIWLVEPPDSTLVDSQRDIWRHEIRLEFTERGDRTQFEEKLPVVVKATGSIDGSSEITWTRAVPHQAEEMMEDGDGLACVKNVYLHSAADAHTILPVVAHYGAGRAWVQTDGMLLKAESAAQVVARGLGRSEQTMNDLIRAQWRAMKLPARRWAAFAGAFDTGIRVDSLTDWFRRETTAAGSRGGRMRPGFVAVKRAVLDCVPGADALWFDADREEVVFSMGGNAQPLSNLSTGQRTMLAMVADIAIRCVTQNAVLLPRDELGPEDPPLPRVLQETPGVVLIDELDAHLHPRWQRRVVADLRRTFPKVQFVATTHSAAIISEIEPECLQLLRQDNGTIVPQHVGQSYGLDMNWVMKYIMGAAERSVPVTKAIDAIEKDIDAGNLDQARMKLEDLRAKLRGDDPTVVGLEAMIYNLEAFRDEGDSETK